MLDDPGVYQPTEFFRNLQQTVGPTELTVGPTELDMGVSKNRGFVPPNHPILIGFSMMFTIHVGGFSPYFWKHPYSWIAT